MSNMASNHSTSLGIAQQQQFPTSTPPCSTCPYHTIIPRDIASPHSTTPRLTLHGITPYRTYSTSHLCSTSQPATWGWIGHNIPATSGPALQNIHITPQFHTTLSTSRHAVYDLVVLNMGNDVSFCAGNVVRWDLLSCGCDTGNV